MRVIVMAIDHQTAELSPKVGTFADVRSWAVGEAGHLILTGEPGASWEQHVFAAGNWISMDVLKR